MQYKLQFNVSNDTQIHFLRHHVTSMRDGAELTRFMSLSVVNTLFRKSEQNFDHGYPDIGN